MYYNPQFTLNLNVTRLFAIGYDAKNINTILDFPCKISFFSRNSLFLTKILLT